ncbi:MAG TPA: hypothetical protein VH475_26105 [Tepidisphaeraceae bacterium]|jgi:hypothetical protein
MPPVGSAASPHHGRGGNNGGRSLSPQDWSAFLRRIERKRSDDLPPLPDEYYVRATWVSFRMEGLDVGAQEVREALAPPAAGERPALRSRQAQRLRNHAAILHRVENDLHANLPLVADGVVRWYVGVSAGLSMTGLDQPRLARVEEVVRRVNSPQLRLPAALQEIAQTHVRLLTDPLVPGFNGILSRLLMRYHLGRCGLPPVVFDPAIDGPARGAEAMARRLVELLEQSYDELLRGG